MNPRLFKSFSQAAQDRFVFHVLVEPEKLSDGTFLDVGACHPTELSNTYALEQLGWRGILVDNDPGAIALCSKERSSLAVLGDATQINWEHAIATGLPRVLTHTRLVDYLSMDVDGATVDALRNLLKNYLRFRVVTVEHDSYRFGAGPREQIEEVMRGYGYRLVCENVQSREGYPFEHWYVHPAHVPEAQYERFICSNKRWTEIFPA